MPKKILIVDDDVDTLRLVGLMLQRQGYQIVAANNGKQALVMAQSESPNLILLDIMMPELDGYEVARRLRAEPTTSTIPIIMFTAKSQLEDRVMGFEVGADDYLSKPTQPQELLEHVREILDRSRVPIPVSPLEGGHVVGILAVKGGLGISTLAANLGILLHNKTRQKVIVAEFRPGEGSLALDLGLPPNIGLNQLLDCDPKALSAEIIEEALVQHSSGIRLLLSSYSPKDAQYRIMAEGFETIARHLAHISSYLLLDLGPGIHQATEKVLGVCENLIVAIEPFPHTITRTRVLIEELEERGFGEERLNIVLINRARSDMQLSWTQVKEQLKSAIAVAFTPVPELAYQAAKKNIPIVLQQPDSLISQQFTKLAETITNKVRQKA